jgi:hypothetical protein
MSVGGGGEGCVWWGVWWGVGGLLAYIDDGRDDEALDWGGGVKAQGRQALQRPALKPTLRPCVHHPGHVRAGALCTELPGLGPQVVSAVQPLGDLVVELAQEAWGMGAQGAVAQQPQAAVVPSMKGSSPRIT